jgi:hypothetical protein
MSQRSCPGLDSVSREHATHDNMTLRRFARMQAMLVEAVISGNGPSPGRTTNWSRDRLVGW